MVELQGWAGAASPSFFFIISLAKDYWFAHEQLRILRIGGFEKY